jgi:GntR family transcriptional regulator, rspAB operon transcriptional repressor
MGRLMLAPLKTVHRQAIADVYADLRARILSLDLPPGSLLSRAGLQEQYRVSSTPLRDALLRLQEEGLVDIYPQSRTTVSRIDLGQARQAQFLRSAVEEKIACHLAADPHEHLVATLTHILKLQEDREAQHDLPAFSALDLSFHRALFEAAGLLGLHGVLRRECAHIDRLRALHLPLKDKVAQILKDHRAIIGAIDRRAPGEARDAMAAHLSQSIAMGDEIRAKHPDFFSP